MGQNIGDFNPRFWFHLTANVLTWTVGPNDNGAFIEGDHAGGWTVLLPKNPSEGDEYEVIDNGGFVDAAAQLTVNGNGINVTAYNANAGTFGAAGATQVIGGAATSGARFRITYSAALNQWAVNF